MIPEQIGPVKIVYLYHSEDRAYFKTFLDHLTKLRKEKLIHEWYRPLGGEDVEAETKRKLEEAQFIVLLISSSFNAYDAYNSSEMVDLVRERNKKGTHIRRIHVRSVNWSSFQEYETFFGGDRPITDFNPQDEAFRQIADKIELESLHILAEAWSHAGDKHYGHMHLEEALSAYEHSLRYEPTYPPALLGKASALRRQNKLEAQQYFEKVVLQNFSYQPNGKNITPSNDELVDYARCRGDALIALERFSEAILVFQAIYPMVDAATNEKQRNLCALAYAGEGDANKGLGNISPNFIDYYKQAVTAYRRAKELNPIPLYFARIGEIWMLAGDRSQKLDYYEQALDVYKQIVQQHLTYAPAYEGQGDACYHLGRFQEALTAYETRLKFDARIASVHAKKGDILLQLKKPSEALQAFTNALSLEAHGSYYYGKGRAQALLRQYAEAHNSYSKAITSGYTSSDVSVHCTMMLVELADIARVCNEQSKANDYYNDAYDYFKYASEHLYDHRNIVYYGCGRICFAWGYWDKALLYYGAATKVSPYKADAYLGKGRTHIELGNSIDALECFNDAYVRCDHPESSIDEADIQVALGDADRRTASNSSSNDFYMYHEKALDRYGKASTLREHVAAYIGLGETYRVLRRNEEAIKAFQQALKLNSRLIQCYVEIGQCYYELERFAEAYDTYDKAINSDLSDLSIVLGRGDALLALKRYYDAEKAFDTVIKCNESKKMAHAYCGKGAALHGLKMSEDALEFFEEANRRNPSLCSQPRYKIVLQEMKSVFDRKLRDEPHNSVINKNKADVLLLLGEYKDAVEVYTRVIKNGQGSADVYCCRGEAYYMQLECQHALKDYRKALTIDSSYQPAQLGKEKVEIEMTQPKESIWKRFFS